MKLNTENIKNHYPILIIKLLIITLFLYSTIRGYNQTNFHWSINGTTNGGFFNYLKIVTETTYFRPTLILLTPLIGIFINKKIGWILIGSFFYYILLSFVFIVGFEELNDKTDILFLIFGMAISLLFIGLMNIKKVSNLTYGITKTELVSKNIIASIIGMSFVIVLVLIKANDIGIKYVL